MKQINIKNCGGCPYCHRKIGKADKKYFCSLNDEWYEYKYLSKIHKDCKLKDKTHDVIWVTLDVHEEIKLIECYLDYNHRQQLTKEDIAGRYEEIYELHPREIKNMKKIIEKYDKLKESEYERKK